MQITIDLPNNFNQLPKPQKIKIVSDQIETMESSQGNIEVAENKWKDFARQLRNKSILSGAGNYILDQSKEFREDFAFKHDSES